MFKEGDTVIVSRIDTDMKDCICIGDLKSIFNEKGEVIEIYKDVVRVALFSNGKKLWVPKRCLDRIRKTVKIEIEVEVSDDAKYVAVNKTGEVYEYIDDYYKYEGVFFYGESRRLEIKNWRETKTKV